MYVILLKSCPNNIKQKYPSRVNLEFLGDRILKTIHGITAFELLGKYNTNDSCKMTQLYIF